VAAAKNAVSAAVPAEPVRVEVQGERTLLHLEGVVGVMQARKLHALAVELADSGREVAIRCEHLQHMDCAAVQVLLALNETLKAKGTRATVENMPDSVQRTLGFAGLASAF